MNIPLSKSVIQLKTGSYELSGFWNQRNKMFMHVIFICLFTISHLLPYLLIIHTVSNMKSLLWTIHITATACNTTQPPAHYSWKYNARNPPMCWNIDDFLYLYVFKINIHGIYLRCKAWYFDLHIHSQIIIALAN